MQCECDSETFQLLKAGDDGSDPNVIYQLGKCSYYGWGTVKDLNAAVECYARAAKLGSFEALKRLEDLRDNESVKTDLQSALRGFCEKAYYGDVRAQFNAGYCHYWGVGTPEDKAKARGLLQMAADQGCADAIYMLEVKVREYYHAYDVIMLGRLHGAGDGYNGMQGIALLRYAAEIGSLEAEYELGYAYRDGGSYSYGFKVEKDFKQAVEWYHKAVDQNHTLATYDLAYCYKNGEGVQKDVKKAFQLFKKAALMGHEYAQDIISIFYEHRISGLSENEYPVDVDHYEAAYWNSKAVDQDNNFAKEIMSDILKSIGLTQDQIDELKKQASSSESAKTWYDIAKQYETGDRVEKDEQKAFEMYKLSARLGSTEGQVALARCYEQGICTEKSIQNSMRWNIRAAMQGNTEATYALQKWLKQRRKQSEFQYREQLLSYAINALREIGPQHDPNLEIIQLIIEDEQIAFLLDFFSKGQDPPDNADTFEACKLAIEYDIRAVYWMVRHYQYSTNIAKDFAGIPQRLEEAAELEETEATYCIARCHMLGLGTPKNMMRAVGCFRFAVEQNHTAAQHELGRCYENGTGVEKNICKAIELYKKAADQNYIPALKALTAIYESDNHQMKDLNQAFQYHKKAAEQDDADEQLYVAKCYRNGKVVKKSDEYALYWYKKAAANKKPEGFSYIAECYEKGIATEIDFLKACTAYQAADPTAEVQQLLLNIIERNKNADGTDSNPRQAFKVYETLTELYPNDANWNRLAEYYKNGIGTPVNFENASNCYLKISQPQEEELSLLFLAQRYENGTNTSINMELAFKAYEHLAKSFPNAENLLKVAGMLENGIGTKTDIEEAIKFYREAESFAELGDLYYEGKKVGKNLLKAGEYYLQAKELTGRQLQALEDIMPIFSKLRQDELKYFRVVKNTANAIRHENNQTEIPVK